MVSGDESVLTRREVTGALRIYTAAIGESAPHFHAHLVPRYAHTPGEVSAFQLFDLLPRARASKIVIDDADVDRISGTLRARLAEAQ